MDSIKKDEILEEYKVIKAEILALSSKRIQKLSVTWVGVAGLISAASISKTPEIAALAIIFVISSWDDDLSQLLNIMRLGKYIETFIEPRLESLNWENVIKCIERDELPSIDKSKFDIKSQEKSSIFLYFEKYLNNSPKLKWSMRSSYGVATLITFLGSWALFLSFTPDNYLRWLIFIGQQYLALYFMNGVYIRNCNLKVNKHIIREQFTKLAEERFGIIQKNSNKTHNESVL